MNKFPSKGDSVTAKYPVPCYYSGYGGRPELIFEPGMVATVASIAPKVRIVADGPEHDRRDQFVVADVQHPATGQRERVGINLCNCVTVGAD